MYVADMNGRKSDLEFVSESQLVDHYNKQHKGENLIDVYLARRDSVGEVVREEYIFSFYTDNYGDL